MSFDAIINTLTPRLDQAEQSVMSEMKNLNVNDPGQMIEYQAKMSLWTRIIDFKSTLIKVMSDISTKIISRFA
ncbi:MAG: type III secretion system needle filament subunit SctF [Parvibaculaceae bacterium]|nr:type III secretion system needle filament subunit SctF [Parvibaculaceae bacterium]